jgi:hypothetical protein
MPHGLTVKANLGFPSIAWNDKAGLVLVGQNRKKLTGV